MKNFEAVLVLKRELENDLAALERIYRRIALSPDRVGALEASDPAVAATAFEIHNYYSVSENLMRRVAVAFENALEPSEWHKQLLSRMSLEIPGVRPALLGHELRDLLGELRKFRHFFRNVYDRVLDPKKVAANLEILRSAHELWGEAIRRFVSWLDDLAARLRTG